MPKRSNKNTVVSLSVDKETLAIMDARAEQLKLTRSGYLQLLSRMDAEQQGVITVTSAPRNSVPFALSDTPPTTPTPSPAGGIRYSAAPLSKQRKKVA